MHAKTLGSAIGVLALISVGGQTCAAQVDPWERVKLVEPGRKVSIKLRDGKSVSGKMQGWTPDGVSVLHRDRVRQLAKADVREVTMPTGMSRAKRAAWAGGIGAVVGAVFLGASCAASGDCDVSPGALAVGGAMIFGGISAGIAALIPRSNEVIYNADAVQARSGTREPAPPRVAERR